MTLGRPFNSRTFLNSPSTSRRSGSSCLKLIYESDLSTRQTTPTGTMRSATPRDRAVSRPRDLWLLGKRRVYCGSALNRAAYERLVAEERARAVVTDPPYNVKIDGNVCGSGAGRHREFAMASGEMTREEFRPVLGDVALICAPPGAIIYACVKTNGGLGSLYRLRHELVFVFRSGSSLQQHSTR